MYIGNSSSQVSAEDVISSKNEVRYLFGGCSGTWYIVCFDCSPNGPIITDSGTYDFCRETNRMGEHVPTEVEYQEINKEERVVQPIVNGRGEVTREDVENLRTEKTTITLLGNPIKGNAIKGKIASNIDLEKKVNFKYKVIGFDGKEYQNGETVVTDNSFNITMENKLVSGTYFIIMGSGNDHSVYTTNFVVAE